MNKADLALRLACFAGVLLALALGELLRPKRALSAPRARRWAQNLGLLTIDNLALRLLFPLMAVEAAKAVEARGWGLLNQVSWSFPVKVLVAFLFLDLAIFLQHCLFHRVPVLWRFHAVHHTDLDIDATTGLRFHPGEIVLSLLIKFAAISLIGAHFLAVLLFEIVLNAASMFSHANLDLGSRLDAVLRLVIVTPDMHRVHHSVLGEETGSNFGFNFSWWDRFFGTYRAQPRAGHQNMELGLEPYRSWKEQTLPWLLTLPARNRP